MKTTTTILTILFFGLFISCVNKKTIYVKQDASGIQSGSSWQDAFTDIQSAIDAASNGDVIWIAAGKYHPKNRLGYQINKGIELIGGFKGDELMETDRVYTDSTLVNQCCLRFMDNITTFSGDLNENDDLSKLDFSALSDASSKSQPWSLCKTDDNSKHLIKISKEVDNPVIIRGITFLHGFATALDGQESDGGAIYNEGKSLCLENCWMYSSFSTSQGGAIYSNQKQSNSMFTLKNTFVYNSFSKGGGAYCVLSKQGDLNISGNLIRCCHAYAKGGGGLMKYDTPRKKYSGSIRIHQNTMQSCSAFLFNSNSYGGGLYVNADMESKNKNDTLIVISNNTFIKCSVVNKNLDPHNSEASGGGLYYSSTHGKNDNYDIIENNIFDECDAYSRKASGAGAFLTGRVLFKNNSINKCYASNNNDEADKYGTYVTGGGVYSAIAILQRNMISNCTCSDGFGGGVYLLSGQLIDSKIINCFAKTGGGVFMDRTAFVNNSLIANNQASKRGGGIYAEMHIGCKKRITRCTIVANKARKSGGAVALKENMLFLENIVYGNSYKRPTSMWGKPEWGWGQQVECVNICGPTRVTLASCALENYSSGGNDNIALAHSNKPSKNKKGYFPYFKQPSNVMGAINPWSLKTKKAKNKFKKIQQANWNLETMSACGDYGYDEELNNPELKTGKIF